MELPLPHSSQQLNPSYNQASYNSHSTRQSFLPCLPFDILTRPDHQDILSHARIFPKISELWNAKQFATGTMSQLPIIKTDGIVIRHTQLRHARALILYTGLSRHSPSHTLTQHMNETEGRMRGICYRQTIDNFHTSHQEDQT